MFGLYRILKSFRKTDLDCAEVRKLSSEYLEGDLAPSRLQRLRAHLSGCTPCQAFVDGLASTLGMLTKLPKIESPLTLKQSIMEHIKEENKGRDRKG